MKLVLLTGPTNHKPAVGTANRDMGKAAKELARLFNPHLNHHFGVIATGWRFEGEPQPSNNPSNITMARRRVLGVTAAML
jgi:hypothetical protein